MKATYKKFALILFAGILCLQITSCAKKMNFARSVIVPAAEGQVKYKKDKNKNYSIDISVKRLANSSDLKPSKSVYVVWMQTDNHGTKNLGQLKSSSGLLSKTLKASMHTVSSFAPQRIFITAENDPSISYPEGETVLTTQ